MSTSDSTTSDSNANNTRSAQANTNASCKQQIRKAMREARRTLPASQQNSHALIVAEHIEKLPAFEQAQHIAVYAAVDGEVSLDAFVRAAWAKGKQCYLPRVAGEHMYFHLYQADSLLVTNNYGIVEPAATTPSIAATELDLVCLPLVAYDYEGRRLGMGGGYYDRCFAFKRRQPRSSRPLLLGVAHAIQKHAKLPEAHWDIALDCIVDERRCLNISNASVV